MVPVSGPVAKIILLAGESGTTSGSTSAVKYFVASPRWPRYSFAHSMLSGSGAQVPLVRSTLRILRAQVMCFSSGGLRGRGRGLRRSGLRVEPLRPFGHALQACPIRVDVGDGARGAGFGAGRIAAAEVALLDLAGRLHVVHRAERAGDGADLAADAGVLEDHLGARTEVHHDGFHGTGMQAPRLRALGARVRHLAARLVEIENLDSRFRRGEDPVVLVGTCHLALPATRAFCGIDVKRSVHLSSCQRRSNSLNTHTIPPWSR